MALTQEQVAHIATWMKAKGVRGSCPGCANKSWTLAGLISAPVSTALGVETSGVPTLQAQTVPAVATVCNDCGYVMLFSAVVMGIR